MKKRLRHYSAKKKKKKDNTVSGKPGKKNQHMCFFLNGYMVMIKLVSEFQCRDDLNIV